MKTAGGSFVVTSSDAVILRWFKQYFFQENNTSMIQKTLHRNTTRIPLVLNAQSIAKDHLRAIQQAELLMVFVGREGPVPSLLAPPDAVP